MNTTAIAQHLNVLESAITEVQEWAQVLWVRVKGLGARFVSKKVVEKMFDLEAELERREKEAEANAAKAHAMAAEILDSLPMWAAGSVEDGKLFHAAIDVIEGRSTFNQVVERFSSKKVVRR